jgi:cell division protein FtsB
MFFEAITVVNTVTLLIFVWIAYKDAADTKVRLNKVVDSFEPLAHDLTDLDQDNQKLYNEVTAIKRDIVELKTSKVESKVQNLNEIAQAALDSVKNAPESQRLNLAFLAAKTLDESDGRRDFTDKALLLAIRAKMS